MDLVERKANLHASLGNASLNVRQAERELGDAQVTEERVRGALVLVDELIMEDAVPLDIGGSLRGAPETGEQDG